MSHEFPGIAVSDTNQLHPEIVTANNIYANTLAYIERGAFHSPKDVAIAQGLASDLHDQAVGYLTAPNIYQRAMDSLQALVPTIGDDDRRYIAGRRLSGGAERLIESRLASPEIDITAPENAWGRLPEFVKRSFTHEGANLVMELTSNCTVSCSFCSFANKGPIVAKASFDSVLEVVRYFNDTQRLLQPRADALYHGTDPFDAKWQASDGSERDYSDMAIAFENSTSYQRGLYTSTAIPIGEEFRVLAFAQYALNPQYDNLRHNLRLSKTSANAERYGHIINVLSGLDLPLYDDALSTNVVNPARRGERAWRTQQHEITPWDIQGPNCRDGVVIKLQGVTGLIMQGASSEMPTGEQSFPIESLNVDGSRTFTIPNYYPSPPSSYFPEDLYSVLSSSYPEARITKFKVDADDSLTYDQVSTVTNDPHRALLRIAHAYRTYEYCLENNSLDLPTAQDHFRRNFAFSVKTITRYLNQGNKNDAMEAILHVLAVGGFYTA